LRAIVCAPRERDRIAFRDVPEPQPDRGEAIVEVHNFSLNRGELRRLAWAEDGWRPGYDVAGIVRQGAADGSGPAAGTAVAGVLPNGAWAERVAIPTHRLAALPAGVAFDVASTIPVAGLTSLAALAHGGLLVGRRVLITGAAGGVGTFAIQLAHLAGAHVTAEVSRSERTAGLLDLGADDVLVGLDASGEPFDFAIDSVGGALLAAVVGRVGAGGTVVSIGVSSDELTTLDWLAAVRRGAVTLYGMSLFQELDRQGKGAAELAALLDLVANDQLRPRIDRRVSWRDLGPALKSLGNRSIAGKVVAIVD
jgi:NADPH2:quinone reductase